MSGGDGVAVALACMFLRGGPGGNATRPIVGLRHAALAHRILREHWGAAGLAVDLATQREQWVRAFERHFLWEEAAVLRFDERWKWAEQLVALGGCVTLADPIFPAGWADRLGTNAPAALYRWHFREGRGSLDNGKMEARKIAPARGTPGPWAAVVGRRDANAEWVELTKLVCRAALDQGYALVSGGATGIDQVARECVQAYAATDRPAEPGNERLPMIVEIHASGEPLGRAHDGGAGIENADRERAGRAPVVGAGMEPIVERWSLAPPGAPFSTVGAMERNALIYAMAECAFAFGPHFGHGGTWHGAKEAIRRRLCPVILPAWHYGSSDAMRGKVQNDHGGTALVSAARASAAVGLQLVDGGPASVPSPMGSVAGSRSCNLTDDDERAIRVLCAAGAHRMEVARDHQRCGDAAVVALRTIDAWIRNFRDQLQRERDPMGIFAVEGTGARRTAKGATIRQRERPG